LFSAEIWVTAQATGATLVPSLSKSDRERRRHYRTRVASTAHADRTHLLL